MKAGIRTLHQADSYGAVLQAYALQQALAKLGVDGEFISISSPASPSLNTAHLSRQALPAFARTIQAQGQKRALLFKQFRENFLHISPPYSPNEVTRLNEKYDFFITGSDQVWNFDIPQVDARYLLPFVSPEKCCSYAASFGKPQIADKYKSLFQKLLNRFAFLSVRETAGQNIIRELTGKESAVCLDPTLLLEKADYQKLLPTKPSHPYILLFLLDYDEALATRARAYAQQANVPLRIVTASFQPQFGFPAWNEVSVIDWLYLIAHAQGVITNSFHGSVFSLLFNRPLNVGHLGKNLKDRNGRLDELLRLVHLEEALGDTLCTPKPGQFELSLQTAKENSLHYLQEVIRHAQTGIR